MPTLTDAIKEAYEFAPQNITYWDTLEFDHQSFVETIKIVNGYKELVTLQGTFIPVLFESALPETNSGVRGEMTIKIKGVPLAERKAIREITSSRHKMTICYRQYIAENANPDSEYPILLQAVAISENDAGIEIKASLSGLLSAKFPRRLMNAQELPGAII